MGYYSSSSDSDDYYVYSCDPCNRTFNSDRALSQHCDAVHRVECGICERVFGSRRAMQQHASTVHAHHCETCSRDFRHENDLAQHRQVHLPRNVKCPGCSRFYKRPADVAVHVETGYCNGCPGKENARRFAYDLVRTRGGQDSLINPVSITDGGGSSGGYQENGMNYQCSTCGKQFKALGSLMQHQSSRPQCASSGLNNLQLGF